MNPEVSTPITGLMTVRKLKEILATAEDSDIIILSKDAEGNDFSPANSLDELVFRPTILKGGKIRWYSGECYQRDGVEEDEIAFNCLTIWPLN